MTELSAWLFVPEGIVMLLGIWALCRVGRALVVRRGSRRDLRLSREMRRQFEAEVEIGSLTLGS